MTRLVICEKPSVAASVAEALGGCPQKTEWGYAGPDLLVAAAAGHLVAELPPEKYDERYKTWDLADLPIIPERFLYQPRDQRAAVRLKQLAELIRRADVTEVINACDAGREGELIFKLIYQYSKASGKVVRRAWFSSMTKEAIAQAFANLRDDDTVAGLEAAARARSEADWIVGMNATRAATLTLGGGRQLLSVGRVQTPTLALIVRRDLAIEEFVSTPYYQLRGRFACAGGEFDAWWRSSREQDAADRFDDEPAAEASRQRVLHIGHGTIVEVDTRTEQVGAPKLFDLTDLQREANKRYGMTAARTLAAAQACYEEHKVLSYPRTDSRYLTSDMKAMVPGLVSRVKNASADYHAAADAVIAAGCDADKVTNDAKVNDHHAIIPTDAQHDLTKLSEDQRRIYDLVARRFLAALLPAQQLERTTVWVEVADGATQDWFRASGRRELSPGWRIAIPETSDKAKKGGDEDEEPGDEDNDLPALSKGEQPALRQAEVVTRHTKAPARLNEASLLGMMATAGRLVEDDELADAMKDSGLGTPATRASIIERLIDVEYVERAGRALKATDKGRGLILALGEHQLTQPDLTGSWERRLRLLERFDRQAAREGQQQFGVDVRAFAREVTDGFATMTPDLLAGFRRKLAACPVPECDGSIVEGRKGYGCTSYRSKEETGCGFVLWKEQAGKKLTEKQVIDQIEAMRAGRQPLAVRRERVVLGTCPRCGVEVIEREKSWGCSSYKGPKSPGCGYSIWKTSTDGQTVSAEQALVMLQTGETNGREAPAAFADCPACKGQIIERSKSYSCNSWRPNKKGCGTTVWKTRKDGHVLSEDEVRAELARLGEEAAAKKAARKR